MEPCAAHHVLCMRGMGNPVAAVPAPASVMEVHRMITSIISLLENAELAKKSARWDCQDRLQREMTKAGCDGEDIVEFRWQESREHLTRPECTQWYVSRGFTRDR